jgi:hypothetical protein
MIQTLCKHDQLDISCISPQVEALVSEERQKELQLPADQQYVWSSARWHW